MTDYTYPNQPHSASFLLTFLLSFPLTFLPSFLLTFLHSFLLTFLLSNTHFCPPAYLPTPLPTPPSCPHFLQPVFSAPRRDKPPRHLQRPRNSTRRDRETNSANLLPRGSCHLPQAGQTAVVSPPTPRLSRRRRCRHVRHGSERGGRTG